MPSPSRSPTLATWVLSPRLSWTSRTTRPRPPRRWSYFPSGAWACREVRTRATSTGEMAAAPCVLPMCREDVASPSPWPASTVTTISRWRSCSTRHPATPWSSAPRGPTTRPPSTTTARSSACVREEGSGVARSFMSSTPPRRSVCWTGDVACGPMTTSGTGRRPRVTRRDTWWGSTSATDSATPRQQARTWSSWTALPTSWVASTSGSPRERMAPTSTSSPGTCSMTRDASSSSSRHASTGPMTRT